MHHCIIASILPMNSATQDFLDILSISFKGWSVLLTEQMPLHCPSHRSRVASNENRKCQKNWQKNDYMDKNWQTTFVWPKNYRKTRFKLLSLAKMGLVSGCVINIKVSTWHFRKIHRFPTRFSPNPFGNPKVVTISRVFHGFFHPPNNQPTNKLPGSAPQIAWRRNHVVRWQWLVCVPATPGYIFWQR